MATQVKFHSVTQDNYSKIPSGSIDPGGLYFVSDNGQILRGGEHIAGTRVFRVVDDASECSAISALADSITISVPTVTQGTPAETHTVTAEEAGQGEYADNAEGDVVTITPAIPTTVAYSDKTIAQAGIYPKGGDMLVVSHTITTGKVEKSAYVYEGSGGSAEAYDVNKWVACDGKVSAANVILTQDIRKAGNYDNVGNIRRTEGGDTFNVAGKSVAKALEEIFTQRLDESTKTNPTVSLTKTNGTEYTELEVGKTYESVTYTAKWNDGSYGNQAWNNGVLQDATGTALDTMTINVYPQGTYDAEDNKQTYTGDDAPSTTTSTTTPVTGITTTSITIEEPITYKVLSVSATNDLTGTKYAADNLGGKSDNIIINA